MTGLPGSRDLSSPRAQHREIRVEVLLPMHSGSLQKLEERKSETRPSTERFRCPVQKFFFQASLDHTQGRTLTLDRENRSFLGRWSSPVGLSEDSHLHKLTLRDTVVRLRWCFVLLKVPVLKIPVSVPMILIPPTVVLLSAPFTTHRSLSHKAAAEPGTVNLRSSLLSFDETWRSTQWICNFRFPTRHNG